MGVKRLDPLEVSAEAVIALGLDASAVDLAAPEALAASLRRAASFLCPTTPGALMRTVTEVTAGLRESEQYSAQVEILLDALVSYGDLLELSVSDTGHSSRQIFLGPPAYVRRNTDSCLLIGVRPEGAPLVGEELLARVDYEGHVRLIRATSGLAGIGELLRSEGLIELRPEQWLETPRESTAEELVASYAARLDAAGSSGDIEGVRVIDPASSVGYYRGRWRSLKLGDTGRFVARRPQAFGADLWCFADVVRGEVARIIDLPVQSPLSPGADEAWRLQAAIDATTGHAQRLRTRIGVPPGMAVLDLFSPVPSWAQRRLDIVGTPLLRSRSALFSYGVRRDEVEEEIAFLGEMMWLSTEKSAEEDGP
jgi:hypothetical protein